MTDYITLDTVNIRTNKHSGAVVAVLYTTDNDLTDGLEGSGLGLAEALFDLAEAVEEVLDDKTHDLIALTS